LKISFSLFSENYLYFNSIYNLSSYNVKSYNQFYDLYLVNKQFLIIYNVGYFSYFLVRNSVSIQNYITKFGFNLDFSYIPNFVEYDDTGVTKVIFPFSISFGVNFFPIINKFMCINLFSYFGIENVYNYYSGLVYGLNLNSNFKYKLLTFGIDIGTDKFNFLIIRLSSVLDFEKYITSLELNYDYNYYYINFSFVYLLNANFKLLLGTKYNIYYNSISFDFGLGFKKIIIFGNEFEFMFSLSYLQNGNMNLYLSLYQYIQKEKNKL